MSQIHKRIKLNIWVTVLLSLLALVGKGFSQGFVNLNFESAKIIPDPSSPYYPYGVAISNALPGWNSISVGILGDITVSVLLTPARQDEGRDGRVGT